jgi:formate-nitrite transporter family protein
VRRTWNPAWVPGPEPEKMYAHVEDEGRRRLSRPPLQLASTSLVAGFDVVFGIVALAVVQHHHGHVAGSIAFGIAFVFIVVGKSELFTENFLVPLAALSRDDRGTWLKLAELWTFSPIVNLIGGAILVLVVTSHGVLPEGTGETAVEIADKIDENGLLTAFLSAVAAGALVTLMTWMVEAMEEMGIRVLAAWIAGALLALGSFNHVIVVTLELIFGWRYGGDYGWGDIAGNFGVAALGNLVGGVVFVTLTRTGQARSGSGSP